MKNSDNKDQQKSKKLQMALHQNANQPEYQQSLSENEIDEERSLIENQIHHLIILTKLQKFFNIVEKNLIYAFHIIKNVCLSKAHNNHQDIHFDSKILKRKINFQKQRAFSLIKDYSQKVSIKNQQGFSIIEICLNKKIIYYEMFFLRNLRSLYQQKKNQSQSNQEISVEQKINDYLIEIVKVFMVITISNLERLKQSQLNDAFLLIKKYSSFKKIEIKKQAYQQNAIKKVQSIMRIDSFQIKKQFRFKLMAFLKLKTKINSFYHSLRVQKEQTQTQKNNFLLHQQNPEIPVYVSSIKTMIVSLNNFQQKSESKMRNERKKHSIFFLNNFINSKNHQNLKSSLYSLFDIVDFEMEKDKLQVLERQINALKEDMEDI